MCGIAGILGFPQERAVPAARRMLAALRHRGPDDWGLEVVAPPNGVGMPAVLAHTRLAILDLSPAGHQPMADVPPSPLPPHWIVYNGEVFNFLELHPELAKAGWPCRTRSDTEAILHAYRAWGEACVEQFHGMFAWCLLDMTRGAVWLCRDRLGIKPLYVTRPSEGGLLFASEVRALLAAGPEFLPPRVHPAALESFLAQGAVWGPQAFVAGVELLSPGTSLWTDWSGRPLRQTTYWTLPFRPEAERPPPPTLRLQAVATVGKALRRAVGLRLLADVPLGLFLSGGVDSAGLATLAVEVAGSEVHSLSLGFDQPAFDESPEAAAVASALGTRHQTLRLKGADVLEDMPEVLAAVDQPTVDGFNTFFVARMARRAGLTVALSGVGGDELFGGYSSFHEVPQALRWRTRFNSLRGAGAWMAGPLATLAGRRGAKAAEMLSRPASLAQAYVLRRELFLRRERRLLMPLPSGSDPYSGLPIALLEELTTVGRELDPVNQVSLFELTMYLRHMLLRDADVFGMAQGLEVRVPLLDHRVVEAVVQLPGVFKTPDPRPKPLFLDAVGPRFPQVAWKRPKRGFTFPWDAWLRGPLREHARKILAEEGLWSSLGMTPTAPGRLWQRFAGGEAQVSPLQILALVVLADYTARHNLRGPG